MKVTVSAPAINLVVAFCTAMLLTRLAEAETNLTDVAGVVVAINTEHDGGRLYLINGHKADLIFRDANAIDNPVFSPDGSKIAFLRDVPMQMADSEIVVIDRKGKILAANFINRKPARELHLNTHQVSDLSWMGSRLLVVANIDTEHAIGTIFSPSPSTELDAAPDIDDLPAGSLTSFTSTGGYEASPDGSHVASFDGIVWRTSYTSCSGFRDDSSGAGSGAVKPPAPADDAPTSASLAIDGARMPALPFDFTPVSTISWYDATRFSFILRDKTGFQVLTVSNIPAHWIWTKPGFTAGGLFQTPPANAANVSFTLVRIPVLAADVPHVVMQGDVGPDKTYNIVVYKGRSATVAARYAISGGKLLPASIGQLRDTLANSRPTRAGRKKIIDNVADVLVANGVDARSMQNFDAFCHDRPCPPLADRGEGARLDAVVSLPPVCVPK